MDSMVKKVFFIVIILATMFSACSSQTHDYREEINIDAEEFMKCLKEKNIEQILTFFSDEIQNNRNETTTEELNKLYNFIEGDISSYEYIGEGNKEEKRRDGKVVFYYVNPSFYVVTTSGNEYRIKFSYCYIWDEKPEYEGICKIRVFDKDNNENSISAGISYYEYETK